MKHLLIAALILGIFNCNYSPTKKITLIVDVPQGVSNLSEYGTNLCISIRQNSRKKL